MRRIYHFARSDILKILPRCIVWLVFFYGLSLNERAFTTGLVTLTKSFVTGNNVESFNGKTTLTCLTINVENIG